MKMISYKNVQEYIADVRLLRYAKEYDGRRPSHDNVSTYLEKQIKQKLQDAPKSFHKEMENNGYTSFDIELLAIYSILKDIESFDDFLDEMKYTCSKKKQIHKIIKTSVFQQGKLKRLYRFLPLHFFSKDDLIDFIKLQGTVSHYNISFIGEIYTGKQWRKWLAQAAKEKEIRQIRGSWI